jgi:hypothetical protein
MARFLFRLSVVIGCIVGGTITAFVVLIATDDRVAGLTAGLLVAAPVFAVKLLSRVRSTTFVGGRTTSASKVLPRGGACRQANGRRQSMYDAGALLQFVQRYANILHVARQRDHLNPSVRHMTIPRISHMTLPPRFTSARRSSPEGYGQAAHRDGEDRSARQDWATDCRTRVSSQEVWRRANAQRRRVQASPAVLSSEAYETWAGPA